MHPQARPRRRKPAVVEIELLRFTALLPAEPVVFKAAKTIGVRHMIDPATKRVAVPLDHLADIEAWLVHQAKVTVKYKDDGLGFPARAAGAGQ